MQFGFLEFPGLQGHLVVDLLALLDDDALGQLVCGEADGGSCDLLTIDEDAALHDQTAGFAVGSGQTGLDHQGQDADGAICAFSASSLPWTMLVSS